MIALIYASRAVRPLAEAELTTLLEGARTRNEAAGISGLLLAANDSFLQILEGDAADVDAVFTSIQGDHRHTDLRIFARDTIDARSCDGWSMGFESPAETELAAALPGYQPSSLHPLVDPGLIRNAGMARTLLDLYARNPGRPD